MRTGTCHIRWIEDDEADAALADIYAQTPEASPGAHRRGDSLHNDPAAPLPAAIEGASRIHFSDGSLSRAQHR